MMRSTAVALALLLASGCARTSVPVTPAPEDAPGRTAAGILNECRADDPARRLACHEAAVLDVLEGDGVAAAMAVAERMGDLDGEVRREGHVYAHAIGLAAYTTADEVGTVFESCTAAYQSGCYHGVIQSYFVDLDVGDTGVDADAVNALCARQRGDDGDRWLLFQCAHGIGHGVTMLASHHLPSALEACDLVADDWERQACYGGAFMESVVQATMPHHSVGRPVRDGSDATAHGAASAGGHEGHHAAPAAADAHAGHHPAPPAAAAREHGDHGVSGAGARDDFPPLKADDPLYPCNVLDDRYLAACYQMQTSAILFFNGSDFRAAADACEQAPERYRVSCFQSLGRDVSARTVQDHDEALELCSLMGSRRYDCHWGYVKNVVDVTAQASDGFEFCAMVPEDEGRTRCFQAVGEQVWVLAMDDPAREEMCAGADPRYVEACRRGAGLAAAAPPADASRPAGIR